MMCGLGKPGYYIKESGDLLIFYGKDVFQKGMYTYDSHIEFFDNEPWCRVHFTDLTLLERLEFEFIGDL